MEKKILGLYDIETIERLADIVSEKKLSEITLSDGEKTITVKGRKCPPPPPFGAPAGMPPMADSALSDPVSQPAVPQKADKVYDGNVVKSPIVGTFYSSPAPDKPPFVKVGQSVKKGDVLMIIESMKLMNEIQSQFSGVVKEILVKSGDPVEFDQPIMVIEQRRS
ncbi:MAG: acetyl-CoA carboxylase biotin carboxyl carrier protein [Oscillospiraceae bacterium]|nr:acetyl-CoA carboxylase biotin carboxyl carrier protein [Oscillospiraceae bacterium]